MVGVLSLQRVQNYAARNEGTFTAEREPDFPIDRPGGCLFSSPTEGGVRYAGDDGRILIHSNAVGVRQMVEAGTDAGWHRHLPAGGDATLKKIDPEGRLWSSVLDSTGQPKKV